MAEHESLLDHPEGNGELPEFDQQIPWLQLLPWSIIGVLVVLGGLTVGVYGMPFESKIDASYANQRLDRIEHLTDQNTQSINQLITAQAVTTRSVGDLTAFQSQLAQLQQAVTQNSIHIEGLEAESRANMAESAARQGRDPHGRR